MENENELLVSTDPVETGLETIVNETEGGTVNPSENTVDKRTSDFKELREHKRQLEAALREREEAIAERERELSYWKGRAEGSQKEIPKPTLEQFDGDIEAYGEAFADWKQLKAMMATKEKETEAQTQAKAQKQAQAARDSAWQAELELAASVDPDVVKAIEHVKNGAVNMLHPQIVEALKDSPVRVELMKHIALSPDAQAALSGLSVRDQAIRLSALERAAISRGGSLAHFRSQPQPVVPPKVGGATKTQPVSLNSANDLKSWKQNFRAQLSK